MAHTSNKRIRLERPESVHPMDTRLKTTIMTTNAVIYTAELLDSIMNFLTPEELMSARQVNKQFYATAQRKLTQEQIRFLLPVQKKMTWAHHVPTGSLRVFEPGEEKQHEQKWQEQVRIAEPAVVNPFLFKRQPEFITGQVSLRARLKHAESLEMLYQPCFFSGVTNKRSAQHVSNPPCKAVYIYPVGNVEWLFTKWHLADYRARWVVVENIKGVTWRDIEVQLYNNVDWVRMAHPRNKGTTFAMDLTKTKVWAIGTIFPTDKEYQDVVSGRERRAYF